METKLFTKSNLVEFVESELYRSLENVPISRRRAYSQAQNPRADDGDLLLVAQFDGTKTAGYLGVLPDYVYVDGEPKKMGWLTCFWVGEEYKSKNVAANLFLRVIRAWKKNIFITNIVPWLEPVYQKTKMFQPTKYKSGIRLYVRFNFAEVLPPKHLFFQRTKPLLTVADRVLNSCWNLRYKLASSGNERLHCECFADARNVDPRLLHSDMPNWTVRSKAEFDWIFDYPWVVEGNADAESKRYYFTSVARRFSQRIFVFSEKENAAPCACAFVTIRDNHLTVPYCFCETTEHFHAIAEKIISVAIDERVAMITVFCDELSSALAKQKNRVLFAKNVAKPYFVSINFPEVEPLHFQDGDGDCVFY